MNPSVPYISRQWFLLTELSPLFSLVFAGPFVVTTARNIFMLIHVENLTEGQIAVAAPSSTARVVMGFTSTQIIDPFWFPRVIGTDNTTSFESQTV